MVKRESLDVAEGKPHATAGKLFYENISLLLKKDGTPLKGIHLEILESLFSCFMVHLERSLTAMAKGMLLTSVSWT